MAKQKGIVKLKGGIGDLSFYKTRDGYLAREKNGISADRIKTDPKFESIRQQMAEFGRANKGAALLRASLKPAVGSISDGRMASRLNKAMAGVVQSDPVNDRGKRDVLSGDLGLLTGFQLNKVKSLEQVLGTRITTAFNRTTGEVTVTLDPFEPKKLIRAPISATHYTLSLGVSACNFIEETYTNSVSRSAELVLENISVTVPPMTASLGAGVTDPVFAVFSIEFWEFVNGKY